MTDSTINNCPKHAYLIIAHNQFDQLAFLISLLDDPRNDIYVLIDRKSEISKQEKSMLKDICKHSGFRFTKRVDIRWGGYSQIEAEMILFRTAFESGEYCFFHLLSGTVLPLTSQDRIHQFFDAHPDKDFLTLVDPGRFQSELYDRVKYHWHFNEHLGGRGSKTLVERIFYSSLTKADRLIQKLLHVDRLKKMNLQLGYGSNWVSLSSQTVSDVLTHEDWIRDSFSHAIICDELFIPSLMMHLNITDRIYWPKGIHDRPDEFQGNLRYINWWDGSPYTWQDGDEEKLLNAVELGHLFSRKFNLKYSPGLKKLISGLCRQEAAR